MIALYAHIYIYIYIPLVVPLQLFTHCIPIIQASHPFQVFVSYHISMTSVIPFLFWEIPRSPQVNAAEKTLTVIPRSTETARRTMRSRSSTCRALCGLPLRRPGTRPCWESRVGDRIVGKIPWET